VSTGTLWIRQAHLGQKAEPGWETTEYAGGVAACVNNLEQLWFQAEHSETQEIFKIGKGA
jgi:hypothetical protein